MTLMWESLVKRAVGAACQCPTRRHQPSAVIGELDELLFEDSEEVQQAWAYCVERYAREEDLAWLRAADYLLLLDFRHKGRPAP